MAADVLDSPGLTSSYQPWSPGASQLPSSLYSPSPVKTLTFQPKQADSGKHARGSWGVKQELKTPPRCSRVSCLHKPSHTGSSRGACRLARLCERRNMPAAGYFSFAHTGGTMSVCARQRACYAACLHSVILGSRAPCACAETSAYAAPAGVPLHELQQLNSQMYLQDQDQQSSPLYWLPGINYQPDPVHQEQPAPIPWWRPQSGAPSQVPCMTCSMPVAWAMSLLVT